MTTDLKTPVSVTQMQEELHLPTLKERRKDKRLCFFYRIHKGTVPAIAKHDYLKEIRNKRQIRATKYSDCVTQNIISRHQNLNKNCFHLPD